jgi:hypothetical protein
VTESRLYCSVTELSLFVRTLIQEGISGLGLISQLPLWREHENMSLVESTSGYVKGLDLVVIPYRDLTLVFLEGVASIRPHGSAMCDKPFSIMYRVSIG